MSKIEDINKEIARLEKEKKLAHGRLVWKCPWCSKGTQIKNLDLFVRMFYVEPYSCTGGDYWSEGKTSTYEITCPKCKKIVVSSYYKYIGTKEDKKCWHLINDNRIYFKSISWKKTK